MYVIMSGNLGEGFKAIGPYEDFDDAAAAADKFYLVSDTWIMQVTPPDER